MNIGKERKMYKYAQLNEDDAQRLRSLAEQLNWILDLHETKYSLQ